MTKYTFLSLILVLFLNQSCKEEIDPSTDGKTTAVVYGLLDQNDTIHYIKINRAFYGGGDALSIAQIADSSYFNSVKGTVKEYDGSTLKRTWELRDTLVTNKESGAFFGPEQVMYYFKTNKNESLIADGFTEYHLEVVVDEGLSSESTITGKTKLITGFSIKDPKTQQDAGGFKFAETSGFRNTDVRLNVGTSSAVECKLLIEFEEFQGSSLKNTKSFEWTLGTVNEDGLSTGIAELTAYGNTFYDLIKSNCSNDNSITKRILKSITIIATAADEDFQKYITVNKPTSSLTQNKPTFTNLTITNDNRIVGIFASRNTQSNVYLKWKYNGGSSYVRCIDLNSTKELCLGTITGTYLFCSDLTAFDAGESFYCD
ncbi:MAG: hypothetical protein HYU67_08175 [Flavobacteriia bacterium]|nr:hypothetical protein [Flavobacteriia bacterium]